MRLLLAAVLLLLALPASAAPACRAPAHLVDLGAPLPRLASAIAAGREPVIVALGSSSTEGVGASAPTRAYPARLAEEMRRRHGIAVKVINRGVGGEATSDMLRRLDRDVLAHRPELVIWQAGSNAALRRVNLGEHHRAVAEGLVRLEAAGVDVVLMSPQYAPRLLEARRYREIVADLQRDAAIVRAGLFKRFEVMRAWNESGIGFEQTLSADGLHMNDWSYGCLARLLADAIAAAAGRHPAPQTAMSID